MNQPLVGFSRETIKKPLLDLGFQYPIATQVINNENNVIYSRSFSKFEKQPIYKVRYEQGRLPSFNEPHEGKFIVSQQLIETKKESQIKWGFENGQGEIKDNFQSWQVNKVFYDIVTNYPDVVIGSLNWFYDPSLDDDDNSLIQPVSGCSEYRITTQFGQEENEREKSQATLVSITIDDNIWGIQATNIPTNFRAYFDIDGDEIELDGSKQIVYSNTLYLERPCESEETLTINFLGEEYNKALEFREQESVGWEHYNEPPLDPENIIPPNGDYNDISFSQERVVITKEGISNNELVATEEETETPSLSILNNNASINNDRVIPIVNTNKIPDPINLGGKTGDIITVGEQGKPLPIEKENLLKDIEQIKNNITIKGSKKFEEQDSLYEDINKISFDSSSGLLVEELDDGFIEISLGSHFKTITTDDGEDVIAEGQDILSLQGGERLSFTGNNSSNIITLNIDVSDLESGISNLNTTVSGVNENLSKLETDVSDINTSISKINEDLFKDISYNDLIDKPNISKVGKSGLYEDLENTPNLSNIAFSGKYTDLINKPDLSSVALSGSFEDLSDIPEFNQGSFIYLVDVSPIDSKETVNLNTKFDGIDIVESFETSTEDVEIKIRFEGGEQYRGNYTANSQDFTTYNHLGGRLFEATAQISLVTLNQNGILTIEGNNGIKEIPYFFIEPAKITSLSFNENSYPNTQSELKEGDLIDVVIEADKEFNEVIVPSSINSALKETSKTVSPTSSLTISLEVKDMGNLPQEFIGSLKVKTAESSSLSDIKSTSNTVTLNNLYPEIQVKSITYPSGQSALKESEIVNLEYSISNFDFKEVIVNDFNITNDQNSILSLKLNSNGRNTGYNISSNNITLKATKSSNGATSKSNSTVNIAHSAPSLTNSPSPKLRTDSDGNINTINLSFDQSISSLSINSFPEGTFKEFTGNNTDWSLKAELYNSNQHSSNSYEFSIESTNLAGITTTHTGNYYIQGFYSEQFQINTNNTLVLDTGINIVNPENLVISSNSPPVNFYLVDSFTNSNDSHKQFKYIAETSVEFNGDIKSFLTGNSPPGSLTVEIEELI